MARLRRGMRLRTRLRLRTEVEVEVEGEVEDVVPPGWTSSKRKLKTEN